MADTTRLDRLRAQLLQSGVSQSNPALFQVIDQLIAQTREILVFQGVEISGKVGADFTFLTATDEVTDLPNSKELIAGARISFDDSTPGERAVISDTINQLTGDVTAGPGSGSQVATIPNNTVTYAKMQDISAASRLLGRGDSSSGDPQEIILGTGLSMAGTTLSSSSGLTQQQVCTIVSLRA